MLRGLGDLFSLKYYINGCHFFLLLSEYLLKWKCFSVVRKLVDQARHEQVVFNLHNKFAITFHTFNQSAVWDSICVSAMQSFNTGVINCTFYIVYLGTIFL